MSGDVICGFCVVSISVAAQNIAPKNYVMYLISNVYCVEKSFLKKILKQRIAMTKKVVSLQSEIFGTFKVKIN